MKSKIPFLILVLGMQLPLRAQQPTVPAPVGTTATTSYTEAQLKQLVPPARPEDVSSPEAVVKAMHEAVSGPQGKWDPNRLRSLCVPNVFFEYLDKDKDGTPFMATITLDQLTKDFQNIHLSTPWYEKAGTISVTRIDKEGTTMAVVNYTGVEGSDKKDGPMSSKPTSTSTLLYFAKRWWVISHTW